ncbi:MAG: hypothetical protein KAS38_02690 [Anaerolineales bacterium]|nr:hypothetical protein [Anaerolineales bacterium]
MATSPTQIANLALSWIGQNQINALGDDQNEAIVMNANFALSRDKVLNDYAWTFAIRREILAPVVTPPAFGFDNQFLIPSDVLYVHRVLRPSVAGGTIFSIRSRTGVNADWVREGQFILSREAVVHCIFVIQITNADLFSPSFIHALAARLAADTCLTFTENRKLKEDMEIMYQTKLADAAFADGRQGRTERIQSNILTGARTR